jgi:hypothetical protein
MHIASEVICDLDEVAIGIAKIYGAEFAQCPVALDWTFFDVHPHRSCILDDLLQGAGGNEAEVSGAGYGVRCLEIRFVAAMMQLYGLDTKSKGLLASQGDDVHAQEFRVENDGCVNVGNGQNQVIEPVESKSHSAGMITPQGLDALESAGYSQNTMNPAASMMCTCCLYTRVCPAVDLF